MSSTAVAATSNRAAECKGSVADLLTGARVPALEFVYECDVTLSETLPFGSTYEGTRRMIPLKTDDGITIRIVNKGIRGDMPVDQRPSEERFYPARHRRQSRARATASSLAVAPRPE